MTSKHTFRLYFFLHFEWIFLIAGLILMALLDPYNQSASICPLDLLGFEFCPGKGLGNSIALGVRGQLSASLQTHPAGLFAILMISARIVTILHRNYNFKNEFAQ